MGKKKNRGSIWDGWGAKAKAIHVYEMKVYNPGEEHPLFVLPFTVEALDTWLDCDRRAGAIAIDIVAYWQRQTNSEEHPQEAAQRIIEVLGKDALGVLEQLNSEIEDESEFRIYRPDGTRSGGGMIFKRTLSDAEIKAWLRQNPGWKAEIAKENHKMAIS